MTITSTKCNNYTINLERVVYGLDTFVGEVVSHLPYTEKSKVQFFHERHIHKHITVDMSSILSRRFVEVLDRKRDNYDGVELASDADLERKFADCLDRGHNVVKHSNNHNMSYGHVCKTCKKYFHRHMCFGGRGSSIGVV